MARLAVLALAALAVAVVAVSAQGGEAEDVEFDEQPIPSSNPIASGDAAAAPPRKPLSWSDRDWTMEIAAGVGILMVFAGYLRGRAANGAIASAISKALVPELRAQFSRVEGASLKAVDAASYEAWATGRVNTLGMLVEVSLKHRQDVLTSLLSSVSGSGLASAAGSPFAANEDTVTFRLRVDEAVPSGIVAAYPAKQRGEVEEKHLDVANYPQTYVSPSTLQLPAGIEVLTDAAEFARAAFPATLTAALSSAAGGQLTLLHLSELPSAEGVIKVASDAAAAGDAGRQVFPHMLRVEAKLPADAAAAAAFVAALARGVLDAVDSLARLSATLPPSVRSKVEENRTKHTAKLDAQARAEQSAKARAEKEAREEAEQEARLDGMTREQRAKEVARLRKKASTETLQPKVKMIRA